jgi:glutamyl-tRNA reductase
VSILLLGVDHQRAPLATLERLAVPVDHGRKVVREVADLDHVLEAVVVSTCNRVEVYVDLARFHDGYDAVLAWMARRAELTTAELEPMVMTFVDEQAAAHLFGVAAGLDSMVVGEQQIAMQVKSAMEEAREEGTAGRMLQRMFRQAVRVGRRVRRETAIGDGARSMVTVGLEAAESRLGSNLSDRRVLVVGAGEMGALTVERVLDASPASIAVWNRSQDKAERLAARASQVSGSVVPAGGLVEALAAADVVVCTTGAAEPVLTMALLTAASAARNGRRLVLLDLAVPRNVAPEAAALPGVTIVDVAAVREVADRGATGELIAEGRAMVNAEALTFRAWLRQIEVEPTIRALRERAEGVRTDELSRLGSRLASLNADQRQAVEALTQGIVNTLLHQPTVRLKRLADSNADHHTSVLAELFDLDVPTDVDVTDELDASSDAST